MDSLEGTDWIVDCALIDDVSVPADDTYWTQSGFGVVSPNLSTEIDGSFMDPDGLKESDSRKRACPDSCSKPRSKACREKMRRDKLNEKFMDLCSILEPGKPPKMDKAAILSDAARMVTQLRLEAQNLKDSNESLQEKIKELKTEKNELREEKQKLKADKENLEQQIKFMSSRPSFMPHPQVIPAAFPAQVPQGPPPSGHKLMMPIISYPSFPMWQFMPASEVDTSQDAESCPPVA